MTRIAHKTKAVSPYKLDAEGRFYIEDYNYQKTFSNFFPGVAGLWGIPMWVFYVNRGQCISAFGIESKDKAMLEFYPANKAYQLTSLHGFRTFFKIQSGGKSYFWEPFQNHASQGLFKTKQMMSMSAHDLTIEDINSTLGIGVRVNYFTVCEEPFPALVRHLTITNISKKKLDIELIDGLPVILPFGITDWVAKHMCRTVEAWVKVRNVDKKTPFYHLHMEVADTPHVRHIHEGNFYFSFEPSRQRSRLLDIIVERECVFGHASDLRAPERFINGAKFEFPLSQQTDNRTPAALTFNKFKMNPSSGREIVSLAGHTYGKRELAEIVERVTAPGFLQKKRDENRNIIKAIENYTLTSSSSAQFDMYCGQTFLDNIMRGGLPVILSTGEGNAVFNVFSRKHGDMERDYNYFMLAPTPFSQGNGNYRDVNQNRRNDVWFNPEVKDNHIIDFLNLIQADGYNPLIVNGISFAVENPEIVNRIVDGYLKKDHAGLRDKLKNGFQPGELLLFIEKEKIGLTAPRKEFLEYVLSASRKQLVAQHGEGFWSDHWTYNLDLIESFLALYPEELRSLLLEKKVFSFYHNSHYVLPRDKRYIHTEQGVRQYHSVFDGGKEIRAAEKGHKLRTRNGEGDAYLTCLFAKLLCLITNKAATLDPDGLGIEMEADKPNWYDALNGLPGLLGSSINETIELKRACLFLLQTVESLQLDDYYQIQIFEELVDFIRELKELLARVPEPFVYWQKANDIKEYYRSRVRSGIAGQEHKMTIREVKDFLALVAERTERAVKSARDSKGLLATYFYYEVTDDEVVTDAASGRSYIRIKSFRRHTLPLFLEGFVHALRVETDPKKADKLYKRVKTSALYDRSLKMYKVNADLSQETHQLGRACVFPPGWLENGSIWLHMEYKYMLELLRCGLYDAFYDVFKDALVPFQDPGRYGRSIIENSSFIVSSVHADKSLHGQGFVARLSGSTAEVLHIWLWMNVGKDPFSWDGHQGLSLTFKPILPGWLFTKQAERITYQDRQQRWKDVLLPENTYAFNFLGSILTVYHNPSRKDTYRGAQIKYIDLTYPGHARKVRITGSFIPAPHANNVREKKIDRLDIYIE